jgi:hypothetical protein
VGASCRAAIRAGGEVAVAIRIISEQRQNKRAFLARRRRFLNSEGLEVSDVNPDNRPNPVIVASKNELDSHHSGPPPNNLTNSILTTLKKGQFKMIGVPPRVLQRRPLHGALQYLALGIRKLRYAP